METSREFVEGLRRELPVWQADGIVTPGAARALTARYELDPAAPGTAPASASAVPRDRSGPFAAAAGIAVLLALAIALLASGIGDGVLLPITALAAAFAAAPLAVRGAALAPAAAALRVEVRVLFYGAAYALSFVRVANASRFQTGLASEGLLAALPPFLLAAGAVAAGLRRPDVDAHTRGEAMLLVATVVAFAAGLSLDTGGGTALVAAMGLAFLAVGRIVRGISWRARGAFIEGIVLAAVLVASHSFDVFPSPWIAAGAAAGCVALAAAAVAGFVRHRPQAAEAASARVA
jgi:hypothetical protein